MKISKKEKQKTLEVYTFIILDEGSEVLKVSISREKIKVDTLTKIIKGFARIK